MFWFLSIRFGLKYFLKINVSVNIGDLRRKVYVQLNMWLNTLYFAQKCAQGPRNAVFRVLGFKKKGGGIR